MHCEEGRLVAYRDGELAGPERLAVEDHVSSCLRCRSRLREFERVAAILAEVPEFAGGIPRGRPVPRQRAWKPLAMPLGVACAMLLVLQLGVTRPDPVPVPAAPVPLLAYQVEMQGNTWSVLVQGERAELVDLSYEDTGGATFSVTYPK